MISEQMNIIRFVLVLTKLFLFVCFFALFFGKFDQFEPFYSCNLLSEDEEIMRAALSLRHV